MSFPVGAHLRAVHGKVVGHIVSATLGHDHLPFADRPGQKHLSHNQHALGNCDYPSDRAQCHCLDARGARSAGLLRIAERKALNATASGRPDGDVVPEW